MSVPRLPDDLLDHIVDLHHDSRNTLRSCSLVSKSWIHRARVHLFSYILFHLPANLKSWKNAFPDPTTSPGCYVKYLDINCPQAVTAEDGEEGGWIRTFCRVVRVEVNIRESDAPRSDLFLTPFHGFSPALRQLNLNFTCIPPSRISDLAHSFPLLEDLQLANYKSPLDDNISSNEQPITLQPSSSPAFTGSLELRLQIGMDWIVPRLLALPGGLRFREMTLAWFHEQDISLTGALVEKCCQTLESLRISCQLDDARPGPINLSMVTKLKNVTFLWDHNPEWIVDTLQSITSDHRDFQRVVVDAMYLLYGPDLNSMRPADFKCTLEEAELMQWFELDRVFVQLRGSHAVKPEVAFRIPSSTNAENARSCVEGLFPESIRRGAVNLAGREFGY